MNMWRRALVAALMVLTATAAHAQSPGDPSAVAPIQFDPTAADEEYRIRPGDVLSVKFFYNPELNETAPVRPDGRISLELIDEVRAAGLTVSELKAELTKLYSPTLKQPVVSVMVRELSPRKVYVGGEVGTPGLMEVTGRLSLVQALFQAGGLRRSAQTGNVVILRYQGTAQPRFMKIDINKALSAGDPRSDVMLQPLDIVWVPKTKIARVNDFMDQYIRQVIPIPLSLGVTYILGGLVQ